MMSGLSSYDSWKLDNGPYEVPSDDMDELIGVLEDAGVTAERDQDGYVKTTLWTHPDDDCHPVTSLALHLLSILDELPPYVWRSPDVRSRLATLDGKVCRETIRRPTNV